MRYLILLLMLTGCTMTMEKFVVDSWVIEDADSGKVGTIVFYKNGSMDDHSDILTKSIRYEVDGSILHLLNDNKYMMIFDAEADSFKGMHGTETYYNFKRQKSLKKDECSADTDCFENQACVSMKCFVVSCETKVINHECVECASKADCEKNEICEENKCKILECLDNDDCEANEECSNNECQEIVCSDDIDCNEGYYCESHECKKFGCVSDFDCEIDEQCVEHECADIVCSKDSDCRGDYLCEDTECVEPECVKDSHCDDDEACTDNECVEVIIELGIDHVIVAPDSNLDPGDTFEVSVYMTKPADFVAYLEIPSFNVMNVDVVEDEDEHNFYTRVPEGASSGTYDVIAKINVGGEFFRVEKTISID